MQWKNEVVGENLPPWQLEHGFYSNSERTITTKFRQCSSTPGFLPHKVVKFRLSAKAKPRKTLGTAINHHCVRPGFQWINGIGSNLYTSLNVDLKLFREQLNRIYMIM